MIQLKNVSRLYPAKEDEKNGGPIRALDKVSLSVAAGEWVAIMGPSGSGKSTLVNLIGAWIVPHPAKSGSMARTSPGISPAELNRVRAEKIGFVFQQFHLIPFLTALENVMLAQYFHSMTDQKEALEALERVGLKDRAASLAIAAVGRRAAAGLHRAGADQRSQDRSGRRADRQSRCAKRRDRPAPAARTSPAGAHHRDGHPRPRRCATGRSPDRTASRQDCRAGSLLDGGRGAVRRSPRRTLGFGGARRDRRNRDAWKCMAPCRLASRSRR